MMFLAEAYQISGKYEEAIEILSELLEIRNKQIRLERLDIVSGYEELLLPIYRMLAFCNQ